MKKKIVLTGFLTITFLLLLNTTSLFAQKLTDCDLELVDGYEQETFKNIQVKIGKSEDNFMTEMKSILHEK